jgi:hypothetical protein
LKSAIKGTVPFSLSGEPVASNYIAAFNFGALGFAGGVAFGVAVTQPVSPGCQ